MHIFKKGDTFKYWVYDRYVTAKVFKVSPTGKHVTTREVDSGTGNVFFEVWRYSKKTDSHHLKLKHPGRGWYLKYMAVTPLDFVRQQLFNASMKQPKLSHTIERKRQKIARLKKRLTRLQKEQAKRCKSLKAMV